MFIASRNHDLWRRSEEREPTSPITTKSLPLLRTALFMLFVVGYKHVTPSGVPELCSALMYKHRTPAGVGLLALWVTLQPKKIGQYRFAIASGELRHADNSMIIETHPTLSRLVVDTDLSAMARQSIRRTAKTLSEGKMRRRESADS